MTPSAPRSPSALPDPLERRRIIPSGPHLARILLVAGAILGTGLAAFMLGRGGRAPGPKVLSRFELESPAPRQPTYADMAPPQAPPTRAAPARAATPRPAPQPHPATAQHKDELWARAMQAGIGGWSRDRGTGEREGGGSAAARPAAAGQAVPAAARFTPAPGGCFVPPGTPIPAETVNRVVTERGGILTAMVTSDVWSAGFDCLAVPAGSTLTMDYSTSVSRGQKRIDIARPSIVRPWPRSDSVELTAMTADASGASGLPGAVDIPWFQTGVLIAASTAVDLTTAVLTRGGSLVGAILGRNADRPLDQAARDLLQRTPVITLEPGQPITVILRAGLAADDFRMTP